MKQRIDAIVGGIQKCGTTVLHRLLRQHPQLIGSWPKEPHFLSQYRGLGLTEVEIEEYHRAWLKKGDHFESGKLYFEASPDACFLHPRHRANEAGKGWGPHESFLAFFDGAMKRWKAVRYQQYLYRGCYGSITLRLTMLFDRNSLLCLHPADVNDSLAEIERFLEVEPFDFQQIGVSPAPYSRAHLPSGCARELREFYEPETRSFSALTGLDVSRWLDDGS